MAAPRRWTSDTGFIYFRVVDQILAGNGPVYNAGERVENFMSPTWMAVLTVGDLVSPARLEFTAALLSLGFIVGALVLATIASVKIARIDDPTATLVPLGSAVFAVCWPVWIWSTGGTEVGAACLWIALCFFAMTRWAVTQTPRMPGRFPVPPLTLVVAGLGWIVRPELLFSSVIFVAVLIAFSPVSKRQRWAMVAIASAIPLGYQVFRMGYYGLIVPNPAIAREALSAQPSAGWNYLVNFVGPYGLIVPVIAIAVGVAGPLVRRLSHRSVTAVAAVTVAVSASGLVHAGVLVLVGGDYVHARLLLPALFAFVAPFSVVAVRRRVLEPLLLIAIWFPICAFVLRTDGISASVLGLGYAAGALTYEDRGFPTGRQRLDGVEGPGVYTFDPYSRSVAPVGVATGEDDIVVVTNGIGPIGYVAGPSVRVVDLVGGADPITAHHRSEIDWFVGLSKAGHASWILADVADDPSTVLPGALVAGNGFSPDPSGLSAMEHLAWARASLDCGQLAQLVTGYRAPLTPTRILDNLWNSLPNTELRFDEDPRGAYAELCGTRRPALVTEFESRISVVEQLPDATSPGEVAIVGRCAQVYLSESDDAWGLLEATSFSANLMMDPLAPVAQRDVLFELGPYDDEGSRSRSR